MSDWGQSLFGFIRTKCFLDPCCQASRWDEPGGLHIALTSLHAKTPEVLPNSSFVPPICMNIERDRVAFSLSAHESSNNFMEAYRDPVISRHSWALVPVFGVATSLVCWLESKLVVATTMMAPTPSGKLLPMQRRKSPSFNLECDCGKGDVAPYLSLSCVESEIHLPSISTLLLACYTAPAPPFGTLRQRADKYARADTSHGIARSPRPPFRSQG